MHTKWLHQHYCTQSSQFNATVVWSSVHWITSQPIGCFDCKRFSNVCFNKISYSFAYMRNNIAVNVWIHWNAFLSWNCHVYTRKTLITHSTHSASTNVKLQRCSTHSNSQPAEGVKEMKLDYLNLFQGIPCIVHHWCFVWHFSTLGVLPTSK